MKILMLISILLVGNIDYEKKELSKIATVKLYEKINQAVDSSQISTEKGFIKIESDLFRVKVMSLRKSKAPIMAFDIEKNGKVLKSLRWKCRESFLLEDNKKQVKYWMESLSDGLVNWMTKQKPNSGMEEYEVFKGSHSPIEFGTIKIDDEEILNVLKPEFEALNEDINLIIVYAENILYEDELDTFTESRFYIKINGKSIKNAEEKLSGIKWPASPFKKSRCYLILPAGTGSK